MRSIIPILLLCASCASYPTGPHISMPEARLLPPFLAVVEDVQRHQVQNRLALAIRLRKGDGSELTIIEPEAPLTEAAFADFLQRGHSYVWPQVFADFEQGLHKPTNKELQTQLR